VKISPFVFEDDVKKAAIMTGLVTSYLKSNLVLAKVEFDRDRKRTANRNQRTQSQTDHRRNNFELANKAMTQQIRPARPEIKTKRQSRQERILQ
jgi:hypothetical protein